MNPGNRFFTRDRSFYRDFVRLAVTLMLEQAVVLSVNLIDNLMLGTYSESALAGVAAVNQVQFVFQQLVYAVGNGMVIIGSQYWGQNRKGEVRSLASIGARVSAAIAILLFVLVSIFPETTLRIFTDSGVIAAEGVRYLRIIRFSYLVFALSNCILSTLRIAGSVRIALRVSAVSLTVNALINYVLIYGKLGFPEMGVEGAAVGTLAARIVELVILVFFLFRKDRSLELRPADYLRFDRRLFKDYLKVGIPVILTAALWGLSNALQTVILGHMSDSAIAAQSISSTLFLLLKVTSVGASTAASILIGRAVGRGDLKEIKAYARTLQVLFLAIGATLGMVMFLIRMPLLKVYQVSDETRSLADAYMIIQSVVLFTMSYQMPVNTGIVRGGGDARFPLVLDLISIWGIVMPVSLLAAFVWKLSPVAVIICLNADQCFKCFPAFLRVRSYKWIKELTRKA